MGTSTNAILCYGYSFEEEYSFPWASEDDIVEWWLKVNGYKPPFQLFDERRNWLNGVEAPDDKVTEYFNARRAFLEKNPIPIKDVMHCSGANAMWILATPSSVVEAYRGYPEMIEPEKLQADIEEKRQLELFCERWELIGAGPAWWLASLWF